MRRRSPGCTRPSRRDDGDSCVCGLYDIISHYKSTILFIFFIGLLGCCCSTKIKTGEASGDRSFPIRILISMLNLCACAVGFGVRLIVSILFCIGKNLPALCSECLTMAKDKHKLTENQLPIKSDLPDIENKKASKMMYERNEHLPRNQTLENDYNTSLPLLEYTAYCSNDTGEVERKHQEIISLLKKHSCYCERTDTMAEPKNQIATSDDCDVNCSTKLKLCICDSGSKTSDPETSGLNAMQPYKKYSEGIGHLRELGLSPSESCLCENISAMSEETKKMPIFVKVTIDTNAGHSSRFISSPYVVSPSLNFHNQNINKSVALDNTNKALVLYKYNNLKKANKWNLRFFPWKKKGTK
ncbi:uncharacterized protein LOC105393567 [Plutella xylostella]|uniref:uncharacterized protein LOC105393567 n=1 Tax=Plutella xylostella TaxID=51655 RepID=UPI0020323AB8|nr:uncharacterized protein LOC105393567 [Plutella xylostella]XP_037975807.2 uncharacterized protein LOC105393567 [Plutella xylostella]